MARQSVVFSPLHSEKKRLPDLQKLWQQLRQFTGFYLAADTKFQLHSPFVFELALAVLEDRRWFYAFDDIEAVRNKMLESKLLINMADYGAVPSGKAPVQKQVPVRQIANRAASNPRQGRMLFRLADWLKPQRILELGTSVGIGTMYLAAAARTASIFSLEGSADCIHVAKTNLEILSLDKNTRLIHGAFQKALPASLKALQQTDLVFFDGHHRKDATLDYFEQCLPFAHEQTVFVFDDIYWSPEMQAAWDILRKHEAVTASVDFFEFGLLFFNPDFKSKQHFKLLPSRWKPWKR